ncbi:hypothetical protein [Lamprobacter modestohalophilus]|nr:hypothetical protein [Lamprobacter modestohalophilus]
MPRRLRDARGGLAHRRLGALTLEQHQRLVLADLAAFFEVHRLDASA